MTDRSTVYKPTREKSQTLLDVLDGVLGRHEVVWVQGDWDDTTNKPTREGVYIVRERVVDRLCQYPHDWDEVVGVNFEDCKARVSGTVTIADAVVFTE